ncbi:hypothetical protein SDC9_178355 [bioreactor metagenome]|uniref:Uncharacterized protein n=1 Tax=bioreactor metagenome TaxID=1076179 RepID=A0A645H3J2_9ZZZZ
MHLAAPFGTLILRENKSVNPDARVIKEVGWQSDNRLNKVVLKHIAANLAFTACGVARKQRRSIRDNGSTPVLAHFINGMLHKQELHIAGSW